MLKNILSLEDVQELSISEQKSIQGAVYGYSCTGDCATPDCENISNLPLCKKLKDQL